MGFDLFGWGVVWEGPADAPLWWRLAWVEFDSDPDGADGRPLSLVQSEPTDEPYTERGTNTGHWEWDPDLSFNGKTGMWVWVSELWSYDTPLGDGHWEFKSGGPGHYNPVRDQWWTPWHEWVWVPDNPQP